MGLLGQAPISHLGEPEALFHEAKDMLDFDAPSGFGAILGAVPLG